MHVTLYLAATNTDYSSLTGCTRKIANSCTSSLEADWLQGNMFAFWSIKTCVTLWYRFDYRWLVECRHANQQLHLVLKLQTASIRHPQTHKVLWQAAIVQQPA